ncbi:hypothetical protein [Erythrobacter sp. AP23]|uniref:hypothetical protein n=1 Tax=Erythrobacter sp. AP23 TaxID=499656 RepID=UPI00076CC34C|nr:hypothetical protein [Erythrobacter sp. AP23]KWV96147.1 hypothetical protein ASS64_02740 [Erythrobacter sp. AP23]
MLTAAFALAVAQATAPAAAPTPPPACEGVNHKAFDFWVGEWDVFPNGGDQQVANSRIEKVSAGCAIRETWMPFQGRGGSSLSAYDPQTGGWHQLWVGGSPGRVFFDGGAVDGGMVLTGYWGRNAEGDRMLVRMTYTLEEDGSVRQYGQASADHGRTWSDAFDYIYRRKE